MTFMQIGDDLVVRARRMTCFYYEIHPPKENWYKLCRMMRWFSWKTQRRLAGYRGSMPAVGYLDEARLL